MVKHLQTRIPALFARSMFLAVLGALVVLATPGRTMAQAFGAG